MAALLDAGGDELMDALEQMFERTVAACPADMDAELPLRLQPGYNLYHLLRHMRSYTETLPGRLLHNTEASSLSDADVLAILLGRGAATLRSREMCQRLLQAVDHDLARLATLSPDEMAQLAGSRTAINVLAELELGRRRLERPSNAGGRISTSRAAFDLLHPKMMDLPHEEFWMIMLDAGLHELGTARVSRGGVRSTVADPKCIFKLAIDKRATCIIVAHNHPSGQLRPSEEDIRLTRKLMEGSCMLDIVVQDHLILTNDSYYSFADNGLMNTLPTRKGYVAEPKSPKTAAQ